MNYLSVENLAKSFDEKQLFEDLTFGLEQGQKTALVGVNGCGKSTLLKVISGLEAQDRGTVSMRKGIVVSMLRQHPNFEEDATILESIFAEDQEQLNVIRDYELAMYKTEKDPENAPDLSHVLERMDALNAWDYEHQIKELLGKLGIQDFQQKMNELSGGQKKRVALAQALVIQPDLLILDEPTNHLDIEVIEWLENYLATQNLTLLMVTHDRYFLDKVTNEILEIDFGKVHRYKGNYSQFLEQKAERMAIEQASVDKAKNTYKTELEWMRRQPKARGTKAKYRVEAFDEVKEKAHSSRKKDEMELNLRGQRQGKKILEMEKVTKTYDGKVMLDAFDYVFKRGERVGIIGKNGVGKSTFLNLVANKIQPDTGSMNYGQTTKIGYYTQDEAIFDPNKKVLDLVKEVAEFIKVADGSEISASTLLNQFLFPPKMQYNFVGKLSGGEKRRLQLMRMLIANPNFLILDEPTNDFDITTLNVLEDYLEKFTGCVMIVSHDRYFMDRLVDHLFVFKGEGKIKDFPGNYSDFRNTGQPMTRIGGQEVKKEAKVVQTESNPKTKKISFKEKHEFKTLEKEMPELEQTKEQLLTTINEEREYEKLESLGKELRKIEEQLEEKEMRWLELSELM